MFKDIPDDIFNIQRLSMISEDILSIISLIFEDMSGYHFKDILKDIIDVLGNVIIGEDILKDILKI